MYSVHVTMATHKCHQCVSYTNEGTAVGAACLLVLEQTAARTAGSEIYTSPIFLRASK